MANTQIDSLEIKITASAQSATNALKSLSNALRSVKTQLSGMKEGVSVSDSLAKSFNELNGALNTINTSGVKKLQKLANGIKDYADAVARVKKLHGLGNLANEMKKVGEAMSTMSDTAPQSGESGDVGKDPVSRFGKLKEVFGKIEGQLSKITEKFKNLGKNIKTSSGFLGGFIRSIGRIALYRAIRSAIKAITEAFTEGLKNAYLYSKQTEGFERLANALDKLKSVTAQMVNQLGAFWGEFRQFIQPAVEWLIEKVRQLTEFLTELFAGLNGDTQYQYAVLQSLEWEKATDNVKEYKHQLLGLDELNNLTAKKDSGKDENDPTKMYELKPVRESFQQIGSAWQSIKDTIQKAYEEIGGLAYLPVGMAALGAILLFTGHPLLGIGLILKGVQWTVEELKMSNEDLKKKIEGYFEEYKDLFDTLSAAAVAIGTLLLFVPGKRALGLGLILGGVMLKNLVHDNVRFSWGGMLETIKKKFEGYQDLFHAAGIASVAIGTMLLFVPGFRGLGLGLIMAGISLDALSENIPNFSWGGLLKTIKEKFEDYKAAFVAGSAALVALGAILLFVPGMRGIGLKLIKMGMPGLFVGAMTIDWDSVLKDLKKKWQEITDWFDDNVIIPIKDKFYELEETLGKDLNGDGTIGWPRAKEVVSVGTKQLDDPFIPGEPTIQTPTVDSITLDRIAAALRRKKMQDLLLEEAGDSGGGGGHGFAVGGIPTRGTLFYAGENGSPEWVGSMGGNSAVANTAQMTDAIYKAAYAAMSQALKDNGGNGLAGFVPASTDDLFIAMRKKSSNYTKMTGSSAFT